VERAAGPGSDAGPDLLAGRSTAGPSVGRLVRAEDDGDVFFVERGAGRCLAIDAEGECAKCCA
jgi:hypothetical protein